MNKKTFKQIVKESPKPKKLTLDTELPYVFDLLYDCKTVRDIFYQNIKDFKDIKRLLAENGFDAKSLLDLEVD